MKIQPVNILQCTNFGTASEKKQNISKKYLTVAAEGAAICGAVILARYNKLFLGQNAKNNFLKTCKSLTAENYKAMPENIKKYTFSADLHSHTNHSDGWGNVNDILNQAAEYADNLFKKTGRKFIFAITDHDRISGAKEALDIIKKNPNKYKNINFIPGVELSFAFNSNGKVKSGELLVYLLEPDSPAANKLIIKLNENRSKMIDNCIEKLGTGFSRKDMENYFINKDGETFAYNLHYRLRNYAQIKNRINKIAEEQKKNPQQLYKELMDGYVFNNRHRRVAKPYVSPEGFDSYLKASGIATKTNTVENKIEDICKEFYPKIKDGKVISNTENSFERIIEILKDDKTVVLGFAHPYYLAQEMTDYKKEFTNLLRISNGKIKTAEIYHQAYNSKINFEELKEINNFLVSKKLIPLGGRDNHGAKFLP